MIYNNINYIVGKDGYEKNVVLNDKIINPLQSKDEDVIFVG